MHASIQRCDQGPSEIRRSNPRLHMAAMLTAFGEFELSADMLSDVEERLVASHHTEWFAAVRAMRARLLFAHGENDRAECDAKAALALSTTRHPRLRLDGVGVLAELALRRGTWRRPLVLLGDVGPRLPRRSAGLGVTCGRRSISRKPRSAVTSARTLGRLPLRPRGGQPALARGFRRCHVVGALRVGGRRQIPERIVADVAVIARSNPELPTLTAADAHARGIFDRRPDLLRDAPALHRSPWHGRRPRRIWG